jgi:hypothetical protein
VLVGAGLGPALWHGEWEPGGGAGRDNSEDIAQIGALLQAEARQAGEFRVLWTGESWESPGLSAARPGGDHYISGARGHVLNDLFQRGDPAAEQELESVIASIEKGTTDRGGSLLGAFNVRYVVLSRDDEAAAWLDQRDLALIRIESRYLLLENQGALDRAAVYAQVPQPIAAVADRDPSLVPDTAVPRTFTADPVSASRFTAPRVEGPGVLFLAEAADSRWQATVGGARLDRSRGGWGNAFEVPDSAHGPLLVRFPREVADIVWLVAIALAWIVTLGAAFSRAKRVPGRPGGRRGPVTHRGGS